MRTYRYIVTGLGNIGRNVLEILHVRQELLPARYGFAMQCVGLADSSGAVYDGAGIDTVAVVTGKRSGGHLKSMAPYCAGWSAVDLAARADYDLLLEATPTNLIDGQPGLDIVRTALRRGKHAILASKGPLVMAYEELAGLSDLRANAGAGAPMLRFSGAVGGGLPSINIGWRDLAGALIHRAELVVNGTTQVMLEVMATGKNFAEALAEAQQQGIVEPDPTLDIDGWDAASKLVIFANAVLNRPTRLADLAVSGIRGVHPAELEAAWAAGGRISLVGLAELMADGDYRLSVTPLVLGPDHPLAHLRKGEMGIVFYSDILGRTTAASLEDGPIGSCAAMIRDIIEIVRWETARSPA